MSICIAIIVPDGIALAADSQTTWTHSITKAKKKGTNEEFELSEPIKIPVGWSRMTKKLFNLTINSRKYAVCVAGAATINNKTSYSIFKSLEKGFAIENSTFDQIIEYFVNGIQDEFREHYKRDDIENVETNILQFIFCGFENEDVSKPIVQQHYVFSGKLNINNVENRTGHFLQWKNDSANKFGGCWIGRSEFIAHAILHNNKSLPQISGQYHLMSLADAVDYTKFLVEFTCDYQRFAVMVPDCARPIISATLTPDNYEENII
jgi:hypothetical protein